MPGSSKRRLFKIPMTSVFPICNYSLDSCWSSQNLKSNILNKQRGVHFIQRQDLIINHRAMYIFCKHIISLRASRTWNHFHSMHNMWFVLVWPARIYSSHTVSIVSIHLMLLLKSILHRETDLDGSHSYMCKYTGEFKGQSYQWYDNKYEQQRIFLDRIVLCMDGY